MSLDRIRTELNDSVLKIRKIGAACQQAINDPDGTIERLVNGAIAHVDELRDNIEATIAFQEAQESEGVSEERVETRATAATTTQRQGQTENRSQDQEQRSSGGGSATGQRLVASGVTSDRDRISQREQERREAGAEIPDPSEIRNYGPSGPGPGESVSEKAAKAIGKMPLAGVLGGKAEPSKPGEYAVARSGNILGVSVADEGGPGENAGDTSGRGGGGDEEPRRTKSGKIDLRTVKRYDRRMGEKPSDDMPDQVG
jgi:hypothetical protein